MARLSLRNKLTAFELLEANLNKQDDGTYLYNPEWTDVRVSKESGIPVQSVVGMRQREFGKLGSSFANESGSRGATVPYGALCSEVRLLASYVKGLREELARLKSELGTN